MQNGTVKRLVAERGFGFLRATDGKEYFFHRSGTTDFSELQEGDAVTFEIVPDEGKGPRAANVALAIGEAVR